MTTTQTRPHSGKLFKNSILLFTALIVLLSFAGSAGAVQVDNWADLRAAVNTAPLGTPFIIEITANFDSASGAPSNTATITIPAGSNITLVSDAGGPFTLTQTATNQRHFIVEGTLTLGDVILSGDNPVVTVAHGGVAVNGGGRFYMVDGQIVNIRRTASADGVVLVNANANFTMTGGIISDSAIPMGNCGIVRVSPGAVFLMDGGLIYNNTFNGNSAAVHNGGTFTLISGTISNNTHTGGTGTFGGSGVHNNITGTFTMYGGEIVGNLAPNGHGAGVENRGTFNMYGGKISGNIARHNSGGLGNLGIFNMRGGEISGNRAGVNGGGISTIAGGNVTLYNGTISGNTAGNDGGGISWSGGSVRTNVAPTDSFSISDNRAGRDAGGIWMGSNVPDIGPGNMPGHNTFRVTEFVTISGNTAGRNGGGVHITQANANLIVQGGTISNNGHETTMVNAVGDTITIATLIGGGVHLSNGRAMITGGTISDNVAVQRGGGIALNGAAANVNMTGGTISNNTADTSGGGVQVTNGQFHLRGGIIDGNQAITQNGGGINVEGIATSQIHTNEINAPVYITNNRAGNLGGGIRIGSTALSENSTFRVNHFVTISGNTAGGDGGGVHMSQANTRLIVEGGTISNNGHPTTMTDLAGNTINIATQHGGGVHLSNGQMTITGGTISDNVAAVRGGGITLNSATGLVNMTSGTISGNIAGVSGGGVQVTNGQFHLLGGTFDSNRAITQNGGGINVEGVATSQIHTNEINAPVYITNNRAGNLGGGVRIGSVALPENNTFRVNHFVTISGNTAGVDGGGIHASHANTRLIVEGGTISNNGHPATMTDLAGNTINIATQNGGGVQATGQMTMNSGIISENRAAISGGAVGVGGNSIFIMNDGIIRENIAAGGFGGGVVVSGTGNFTMNDGYIEGNLAGHHGGGVHVLTGIGTAGFIMTNGTIRNNSAGGGGGVATSQAFIMSGGRIYENTATGIGGAFNGVGGGVLLGETAAGFIMSGDAEIFDNFANCRGGGVFTMQGLFDLRGGTIRDNTAQLSGGGIYFGGGVAVGSAVTGRLLMNQIDDPIYITGNRAGADGGGVFMRSSSVPANNTLVVNDKVTISGNTAAGNGGGVHMAHANARLTMTGGEISNNGNPTTMVNAAGDTINIATQNGGGIWIDAASRSTGLNIGPNAVFSGNSAEGGIFDYGLALGQTAYPNIEWSAPNSVPVPAPNAHLLNNFDINNNIGVGFWPITFDLNGGNVGGDSSNIIHILEASTPIGLSNVPAPVFSDLILSGWQQGGIGTTYSSAVVANKQVSGALTFVAVWAPAGSNGGGGGGNGTGNATIREPARGGNTTQPPVAEVPYAYERPEPEEIPVIVILLFVIGIAAFAYRKVEEAKEDK